VSGKTICNTVALPTLLLAYPVSGSAGVATTIGSVVVVFGLVGAGKTTVSVAAPSGFIAVGTPGPAPSPLPSPMATPAPSSGTPSYSALALPTLMPSTRYTVTATYSIGSAPAACLTSFSTTLGFFTTG
jgi:hypothetical protein